DSNGPDAAPNVQVDGHLGVFVGVVEEAPAFAAQPRSLDFPDTALDFAIHADIGRQSHSGFPDAAADADLVVVLGIAAKIEIEFSDSHFHLDAPQGKTAQTQVRFTSAEVHAKVHGHLAGEAEVPFVFHVAHSGAAAFRLFDAEAAVSGCAAVVDVGLPGRDVVGEVGAHQLFGAAVDAEIAGAHVEIHRHPLGGVQIDGAHVVLGRAGRFNDAAT